jgi:glycosyltransferase involved in cell wall biosynthesis
MKPLVSVVIPAFNAEQFLERTLSSVQQQTYENIEIIIVNDGSTDASEHISAKFAASDPRIKTITQTNSGVASARNRGLHSSSGEYVAFLDADDIWHPTKVERQMAALLASTNSTGYGAVYTLHRHIDSQDRVLQSGRYWSRAGGLITHLVTLRTECGSKILVRRDLALGVGGYETNPDTNGVEDFDFELKLAARFPMFVVSEYLVGYRKLHTSLSSDETRMLRGGRAVINRHIGLNNLSKPYVNWVYGEFHKHFFFVFLERHKFIRAFNDLIGLIVNDPAVAWSVISSQAPVYGLRKMVRLANRVMGVRPQRGPDFYTLSPLESYKPPRPSGRWDEETRLKIIPS